MRLRTVAAILAWMSGAFALVEACASGGSEGAQPPGSVVDASTRDASSDHAVAETEAGTDSASSSDAPGPGIDSATSPAGDAARDEGAPEASSSDASTCDAASDASCASPDECISAVASTCRTNASAQCLCGIFQQGLKLTAGQSLWSCDGHYQLEMQNDGNLVLYQGAMGLWQSNTAGSGSDNYLVLQDDGNLVVYTSAPVAVWTSQTQGNGCGVYLAVQTDGNVVLYTSGGTAFWDTGT